MLGPADGRYLTRAEPGAPPGQVIVLGTLGAPQRRLFKGRKPKAVTEAQPEPVPTARATLIGAEPFDSREQADAWLEELRGDDQATADTVETAVRALNVVLRAHRAAALDPYSRDVSASGALVVRVGYGSGDQVADGRFAAAYELPRTAAGQPLGRAARRRETLAPQERLAAVLGGRDQVLAGEELVLRARADLDAPRPREAALQARVALEALIAELGREGRDVAELRDCPRAGRQGGQRRARGRPPGRPRRRGRERGRRHGARARPPGRRQLAEFSGTSHVRYRAFTPP